MTRRLSWLVTVLVAGYLVAPTLVVLPASLSNSPFLQFPPPGWSLQWYRRFFATEDWVGAALVSLQVAVAVTVLATILGTLAAVGLTRSRGRLSGLASTLLATPLIVPVVIYAIGSYGLFIQLHVVGTRWGLIMAHTALALPFVVINVSAPLRGLDRNVERGAASLGAPPLRTFRDAVLPQIAPGVLAGALFAFLTSFNEVVLAIFLTDPATKTLPVRMWSSIRLDIDPTIAAAATLLVAISGLGLAVPALLGRRSVR